MRIDDKIRDEKLQYNINIEVTKISALSPNYQKYCLLIKEDDRTS